jgi:hypothetical protein
LSLGQPDRLYSEASRRAGPRSRKALALVGALVLSVLGLIFLPSREARAQQLPQDQQRHAIVAGGVVTKAGAPNIETLAVDPKATLPTTKPVTTAVVPQLDPPTPPGKHWSHQHPAPGAAEPAPKQESRPELERMLPSVSPINFDPASNRPVVPVVPRLAAFERNKPVSARVEVVSGLGPPTPDLKKKGLHLLSGSGPVTDNATETFRTATSSEEQRHMTNFWSAASSGTKTSQNAAVKVPKTLTTKPLSSPAMTGGHPMGMVLGNPFSKVEAGLATMDEGTKAPESPSEKLEDLPKDAPHPLSPSPVVLLLEGSFSSSGIQLSPGGSVALLLLCVLITSLILLWYGRPWRVFYELPKPKSVLPPALERPG